MKTIETTIVVDESHQATVQFPADVHRTTSSGGGDRGADDCAGPANFRGPRRRTLAEGFSIRREEIYGDDGR